MTSLFEAAGLDAEAPRPLADRLRPQTLAEVVGQDHLLAGKGPIARMRAQGRLASLILWGPPGVGKTSALAKTAARAITAGAVPTLISCDGERAGANDRLQELARRMGAGFRAVDDPREMIDAVDEIDGPILIDSPAVNPFELDDLDMTLAFADSANAEILYVFDAGLTPEDAEDAASLFASIGASRCIPVKLDCARRLGAILGVGETGLAFAQISSTPFIGGGLAPATPLRLARVLVEDRNTPFEEED